VLLPLPGSPDMTTNLISLTAGQLSCPAWGMRR
jgi:hypothetical protein